MSVRESLELTEAFERTVAVALAEDLGREGTLDDDETTRRIVPETLWGEAVLTSKQDGVVCGLRALVLACAQLDREVSVTFEREDGEAVAPGDVVATIDGPVRAILVGERAALNLVAHLSGIATMVRRFTAAAPAVEITDTRKTLPGLRLVQKYAVRVGGGANHRFSLRDGVLVKDNHIVAAGGVGEAVRRAKTQSALPVQVECTTLAEVDEALDAGAPAFLLDNRPPDELRAMVARIRERSSFALIEASGGVTLDNIAEVAATGVDRVSVGAFTHSAPALDLSLSLVRVWDKEMT